MDFEIGNLLYIVITLVAVIVGVLGKKKKPADGGSGAPGESAARPGFLENLERVLQMGQEQPEIKDLQEFEVDLPDEEVLSVEESHADLRNRPSIMDEYDRIMNRSNEGEFGSMMAEDGLTDGAMEVLDLDGEQGNNYFEIVRDFDAGTAVVYSTIINRLDY
jgi:hypothetical protein